MTVFRRTAIAVTAAAVALTLTGAASGATSDASPRVAHDTTLHLAYLGVDGQLYEVDVTGTTVSPAVLISGPATGVPTAGEPYGVYESPDGKWLAWSQAKDGTATTSPEQIVLCEMETGAYYIINSDKSPIGFAGDHLIAQFNSTFELSVPPKPVFTKLPNVRDALGGYPGGTVTWTVSKNSKDGSVRLTTFAGKSTTLHSYTDFGNPNYRTPDEATVSDDGDHLLIERGNHQDFGGLGHSSLVDEFAITAPHTRTQLGHYGTSKYSWRVTDFAYGVDDQVWASWEALENKGKVASVVAKYTGGKWQLVDGHAIFVASDSAGDTVIQDGVWRLDRNSPADQHNPTPTAFADLLQGGQRTPLHGVAGTQFFWVAG